MMHYPMLGQTEMSNAGRRLSSPLISVYLDRTPGYISLAEDDSGERFGENPVKSAQEESGGDGQHNDH